MARRRLQLAWLLAFLIGSPLFASGPTGSITSTITDPSGAVAPKAHVTVLDEATNTSRDAVTNEDGDYTVALLPPGRYSVSAESTGFHRSIIRGVSVDVDQTVRLDFELQVGAAAEEVNVTGTPPIVQSDTSTLGQVINNRLVQELPLNERNFLVFALLVPGAHLPAEGSQNSTQGAPSASTARVSSRTTFCSTGWTTTTRTSTNMLPFRRLTPFRNSRCNPAIIPPSLAGAAAPRLTSY